MKVLKGTGKISSEDGPRDVAEDQRLDRDYHDAVHDREREMSRINAAQPQVDAAFIKVASTNFLPSDARPPAASSILTRLPPELRLLI